MLLLISYRSSGEKLIKYLDNLSCKIMSVIRMTTLFYKALTLQREIWCWPPLGLIGVNNDDSKDSPAFLICLDVSAWCGYESHVLVQNWLCDWVMQLWVTRACPDLTIWLRDAVMSHTCLSWSDYLTAWCRSSQRPIFTVIFHPCSPSNLQ